MKFGAEIEFFAVKQQRFVFPADFGFGHDGYPLLGELRTGTHTNPFLLIGELKGLILEAQNDAKKQNLKLIFKPEIEIPIEVRREAIRRPELNKTAEKQLNMYGYSHEPVDGVVYAGLHVHFSGKETQHTGNYCEKCKAPMYVTRSYELLPMPAIIKSLDETFEQDIESASRIKGSYEMKDYGFEYRSLPNNVSLDKLAIALSNLKF